MGQMGAPELELRDIQGDMLIGLQKQAELFLFFKIIDVSTFKAQLRQHVTSELTPSSRVHERERIVYDRQRRQEPPREAWLGVNLGFTKTGLTQLLGTRRPAMETAF